MDVADSYVTFVRHSQDMLREKVNEEVYVERIFDVSKLQHCLFSPNQRVTPKFHLLHLRLMCSCQVNI